MAMVWWSKTDPPSRDHMSARMYAEIAAMRKVFGKAPVHIDVSKLGLSWDTNFYVRTVDIDCNTRNIHQPIWSVSFQMLRDPKVKNVKHHKDDIYRLKIVYPTSYPNTDPRTTIESHDISGSPHLLGGGVLCLFDHSLSRSSGWDPAKSTVGTIAIWSVLWVRAHNYWLVTHSWPLAAE